VPEEAVGTDLGQRYLYVVDDQNRAAYRKVRVGAVHGDQRVIEDGLREDEHVILRGLKRVRPEQTVRPVQEAWPARP
jgi:multidrug efflux pump subunit AcrA (membrane-fusion protein)